MSIIRFKHFKQANIKLIDKYLQENLINTVYSDMSNMWENFDNTINIAIELFVPITKLHKYKNQIITTPNFNFYKKLHRSYLKYKITHNTKHLNRYKQLKRYYKLNLKRNQTYFEKKILNNAGKANYYKYIRNSCSSNDTLSHICKKNSFEINDQKTIADEFNKYFVNNFNSHTDSSEFFKLDSLNERIIISALTVKQALHYLRNATGVGFDGIPIQFWTNLSDWFPKLLSKLFTITANSANIPLN